MAQRWWYSPSGSIIGFLDHDRKSLFETNGTYFAYIERDHIYDLNGSTIGYFDSNGKDVYSLSGQHLGYFEP